MAIFRWPDNWDPLAGLRVMHREIERLTGRQDGVGRGIGGGSYPSVNVLSSADEIVIECELPGIKREDIDLSIAGETVIIKGSKKCPCETENIQYHRRERGSGDFSRTIVLPEKIDADNISASMNEGILTIHLPKSQAAMLKKITVR
jgi:HSP20 family protein